MFRKIVELIKEALRHFVSYDSIESTITSGDVFVLSEQMQEKIDLWKSMYKDEAPWLNDRDGIFSLGIPKEICQSLAMQVLAEMDSNVVTPGDSTPIEEQDKKSRAGFINDLYHKRIIPRLPEVVEKGMAMGGVIIKPYVTETGIFYDFSYQGEFVPISFDDDGNIIDIAFRDQFIEGSNLFTKIERQTFNVVAKTVTIQNKAFVSKVTKADDTNDGEKQQLGNEIPLDSIGRWKGIEPVVVINEVEKPLYGYYKVPLANNVDFDCPMGISVFSPAISLIKRADFQFSRLDWEYEGGQMAIDIDQNALTTQGGYFGTQVEFEQDDCRNRLYRKLDLGVDDTYNVFAPSLRDDRYINGLNTYLSKIEDLLGIARGTLNDNVPAEARTATEIRILKQRTFTTIATNQQSLEGALNDVIYATDIYASLYNIVPAGEYELNTEWQDSVLSDTQEELNQRLQLKNAGVLSDVEIRMWYTGEDETTAQAMVDKIKQTALDDVKANQEVMGVTAQDGAGASSNKQSDNTKKTEKDNDRTKAKQEKDNKKIENAKKN